jgi:hypothetical protein
MITDLSGCGTIIATEIASGFGVSNIQHMPKPSPNSPKHKNTREFNLQIKMGGNSEQQELNAPEIK